MSPSPLESTIYAMACHLELQATLRRVGLTLGAACRTCADASEFLSTLNSSGPTCIVTLLSDDSPAVPALLDQLTRDASAVQVVLASDGAAIPTIVQAMRLGAVDVTPPPHEEDRLVQAVAVALEQSRQQLAAQHRRADARRRMAALTPREREVMALVAQGMTNCGIAEHLHISARTVETHRGEVMKKTRAHSLAELVRLTLLLSPETMATRRRWSTAQPLPRPAIPAG